MIIMIIVNYEKQKKEEDLGFGWKLVFNYELFMWIVFVFLLCNILYILIDIGNYVLIDMCVKGIYYWLFFLNNVSNCILCF